MHNFIILTIAISGFFAVQVYPFYNLVFPFVQLVYGTICNMYMKQRKIPSCYKGVSELQLTAPSKTSLQIVLKLQ